MITPAGTMKPLPVRPVETAPASPKLPLNMQPLPVPVPDKVSPIAMLQYAKITHFTGNR